MYLVNQDHLFLVRDLLWFGELIEPPPWLEDEAVPLDEGADVTSVIHVQDLKTGGVYGHQTTSVRST